MMTRRRKVVESLLNKLLMCCGIKLLNITYSICTLAYEGGKDRGGSNNNSHLLILVTELDKYST